MGKPHPMELRTRVVDFVEEGNTHRATAAHFRVSIKFVNDMVKLKRESKNQENPLVLLLSYVLVLNVSCSMTLCKASWSGGDWAVNSLDP